VNATAITLTPWLKCGRRGLDIARAGSEDPHTDPSVHGITSTMLRTPTLDVEESFMALADAFAAGVDLQTFMEEHLADLAAPFMSRFGEVSDTEVIFAIRAIGNDEDAWTITVDQNGVEVEEGEGYDDPLITMIGHADNWDVMRSLVAQWTDLIDDAIAFASEQEPDPRFRLTRQRLKALQRQRGTIKLSLSGVPDRAATLDTTLVLNAFTEEACKPLHVQLDSADLLQVIEQKTTFEQLYTTQKVRVQGDLGLPMRIAGAFMAYS